MLFSWGQWEEEFEAGRCLSIKIQGRCFLTTGFRKRKTAVTDVVGKVFVMR